MIPPRAFWLLILLAIIGTSEARAEEPGVALGDPAPPIVAARWIRGAPIQEFERGQVYIVDCWSTWCMPCIASLPALHALEAKFAETVIVIGMNVWELDRRRIPEFMASHGSVLPAFVALDSIPAGKEANEGLMAKSFLGTTKSASIPRSFIIDQEGRVAWIGQPKDLEDALSRVLEGTWDVSAFADSTLRTRAATKRPAKEH
jgi:thiol-disulfide isomerase/thioredoxin